MKEREHLGYFSVNGRISERIILTENMGSGLDSRGSEYGAMSGCCKHLWVA